MKRRNRTDLQCIRDRLQRSRSPAERRALFVGRTCAEGDQILVDIDLVFRHMDILGPAIIGKTAPGIQDDRV